MPEPRSQPNAALARAIEAHNAGNDTQAMDLVRRHLASNPRDARGHAMASMLALRLGSAEQGVYHAERAVTLEPDDPGALTTLGKALASAGRAPDAIEPLERATTQAPAMPEAWASLGAALSKARRLDDALRATRRALELRPGHPETTLNLGLLLLDTGDAPGAAELFGRAAQAANTPAQRLRALDMRCVALHDDDSATAQSIFETHAAYGSLLERLVPDPARPVPPRDPDQPLRVGYLSPDMRAHSVSWFLEPILRAHDPERVHATCYSTAPRPDGVTARLRSLAHRWVDASGMDDRALSSRIASDRIDVLVELSGHFTGHRLPLLASRPAHTRVSYLGYPGTTGLTRIDARLVDATNDPEPDADRHATERLVRLPGCFLCYHPPTDAPPTPPTPPTPRERVVFGSFNAFKKISSTTLDMWAGVLEAVPESGLIVKNFAFSAEAMRDRLVAGLSERGIDASRVDPRPPSATTAEHLAVYREVDIALDTFPYQGTTTTCEALWMGVPVLTMIGDRHASRVGASILRTLGLGDLVTSTPAEYTSRAAELAADTRMLASLRTTLRDRMNASPLCDGPGFTRTFEDALISIRDHATGAPA